MIGISLVVFLKRRRAPQFPNRPGHACVSVPWPLPPPGAARRRRRRAPRSSHSAPCSRRKTRSFSRARARATSAVVIPVSRAKWSPVLKTLRRGALLTLPCGTRTLRFWCERWLFNSQHERPATLYIRSHNFSTAATLATLTLCLPMLARLGTLACERHLRMRHPNVPTRERCHWEGSQGERRNVPWPSERALCQKGPARDLYLGLRVPT